MCRLGVSGGEASRDAVDQGLRARRVGVLRHLSRPCDLVEQGCRGTTRVTVISVGFLRTNAYSLVEPLGAATTDEGGPGSFSGQLVSPWQAMIVCAAYVLAFAGIIEWILRRRDVR